MRREREEVEKNEELNLTQKILDFRAGENRQTISSSSFLLPPPPSLRYEMRTAVANKLAAGPLAYLVVLSTTAPLHSTAAFYSSSTSITSPLAQQQSRRQQRHHRDRVFSVQTDMSDDTLKILGVCGGIGSGKSTACKLMVDVLGCVDRIGKLWVSLFSIGFNVCNLPLSLTVH